MQNDIHAQVTQPVDTSPVGFTLLELLVVVAIISLLVDALQKALDQFRLDVGQYPSTEFGLAALITRPANAAKWNGPYLAKSVPPDPWGKPYIYKAPGERGDYDLMSYGKDGQPGGSGENADITNY
jgi:general secretion pathway protein G